MKKYMTQEVAIKSAWMILEGLGFSREINGDLEKTITAVYESAPAADVVEVRHCRWERTGGNPYPSCSECGCESLSRADRPYCQFCGARMDGDEDGKKAIPVSCDNP